MSKPKTRLFLDRDEAVAFAESKMGRKGMVLDTTLMTAEQLEAHKAREAWAEEILKAAETQSE
ncbi:hypothetical protein [Acidisoma silvae]|uniref:Uncharacterized protein n=1 Tax=Acidisoma silvae TaxID=2802396 RepID=A0A964E157_9PROT|nr:hypothetical protein [Acidisoma silvae]MCB8877877.1 hypothetical protein [Acidisoma silvae]